MPCQTKTIAATILGVFLFLVPFSAQAQNDSLTVQEVLTPGSTILQLPVFHEEERAGTDFQKLFNNLPFLKDATWARAGQDLQVGPDKLTWQTQESEENGFALEKPLLGARVQSFVFYVKSNRWQKATLEIQCPHPTLLYQGQELVSLDDTDDNNPRKGELTLPIGKHQLTLRILLAADSDEEGELGLALSSSEEFGVTGLIVSTDPTHAVDIETVLNAPRVSEISISPDGRFIAVQLGEYRDGKTKESWLEIRQSEDLKLVRYLRGEGVPSSLSWYPGNGKKTALTWETRNEDVATVWLFNLAQGEAKAVLESIADLGRWQWAPDGSSIIYEIHRSPDPDTRRVKHVANPADRQPWWRDRNHLWQTFPEGGFTRQLTAGPLNPENWKISPDSRSLVFFTSDNLWTQRPFHSTKLWLLDLENLDLSELLNDPWIGDAIFSPDSKTLCLTGSPSAFDGMGRNLPDGVQANDYGGQVYLMDIAEGQARPISIDFVPDVARAQWSNVDGKIYARCTDTQHSNIHRYDLKHDRWEKVETGVEYTNQLELPNKGSLAVVWGTSANHPNTVQILDLKKNRVKKTLDPGTSYYEETGIVFGKVETWVAELPNGEKLDGMVYYPSDFDPQKEYPLIVYYYGGTSPVTRDFGGRYPKNVWAGQGYVVYVPNPSGATGYGQAMAARHVNDWGIITAGEVVQGTQAFLKAHEFIDPERVGCMGASYGGFLTEYIITQSDIFAAAVSHAGISSISSYWGEGMWGYAYGTRALANSYPWQNRQLYVEQSPLFHADKITTPLLLVHGDSDINVPIGESDQLFTALKILGREVEYVQIMGQDHHILDHEQRIVWNNTILAFFARHLKDRPQWWDALYPEPTEYR